MEMKLSEFVAAFERGEDVQEQDWNGAWIDKSNGSWLSVNNYRLKPKPAECWVNFYNSISPPSAHKTKEIAEAFVHEQYLSHLATRVAVHMKEVV